MTSVLSNVVYIIYHISHAAAADPKHGVTPKNRTVIVTPISYKNPDVILIIIKQLIKLHFYNIFILFLGSERL